MKQFLSVIDHLPDGFFDLEISNIREVFPVPTLLRLQGDRSPPLFVSILQHGNEYSGLESLQLLLERYPRRLPRSLHVFIGNVEAAEANLRMMPDQDDFNRCWPGTDRGPNNTTRLMREVFDEVTRDGLFAAIDLHNNTGTNPHYAGITDVRRENQHLAAMFNHVAIVFSYPKGVATMAFNGVCPAVVLECGRPGERFGIEHATEMLDALLHLDHFPDKPVAAHDLQLVRSELTLKIPHGVTFDFHLGASADLTFENGFERKNFTEIKSTDVFAHTRIDRPLSVINQCGENVTDEIMRVENGKVYLNRTMIPAMITLDKSIIRQDCLCYLMVDYQDAGTR